MENEKKNDEFDIFRNTKDDISKAQSDSTDKQYNSKPIVLIIDDDQNIRDALMISLGKKYNLILCSNGWDGINRVSPQVYTVILDIKMEGKNGFDTFIEIKQKNEYVPIIFHSAYQDLKSPFEIINDFRPFGYVVKGESNKQLLTMIDSGIDYYNQINKNILLGKKLQIQEEQYRTLVNNLNVGVYRNTGGLKGSFLQANPALAKILGYETVDEFMKKSVSDFYLNQKDRETFV
ncbi:MAG: response regulator [Leptospiraceae bacterium]|nr:response regulator [Leptospiraceae bacterium]